jgi:hypothetical protein
LLEEKLERENKLITAETQFKDMAEELKAT